MKKFDVVILPQAEDDFRDAVNYYSDINQKLAKRFIKVTKSTVNELKKMPLYQIKYDQIRLRIIHKFPYAIHFSVNEELKIIYIWGIRYATSNPENWPRTT
jgi:plasmid stabilization system protein ParE